MSCLCGSTYLSPSFTVTINGQEYSFFHKEESFLRAEQVFSTISEHVNDSFDSISINVAIVLDHKIKVVLKNRSGDIIGSKYIGKTDQRTVLDKITFDSCDLLLRNVNDRIVLQIYSICDFSADECCDKLPSSVSITPIITSFCVTPTTTTTTTENP
jgi:hypothetical protein